MVDCNFLNCSEEGKVRRSDCKKERYVYVCYGHREVPLDSPALEIDRYQYWDCM